ncbi:penicillin-binding transpeptidase domain-containing protein [Leptospira ellisii]|uniref:penicillin-binding transpeptidase domain-containing protein n=1 Tax=Leptospira ellisii TaxID=2023197 RepID=UPI001FAEA924|nr:penicillin-binding transpeptidase domain-containing protein [Leptospira ellisii]
MLNVAVFLVCRSEPSRSELSPMSFSEKKLGSENGRFVCAILTNVTARNKIYFQKEECSYKTPPSSLYHPVLTLVALENGYLKEDQSLFFWDKTRYPYIRWQKDQNLGSALEYSVQWYFTKLWNDIGPEKGKQLLERAASFSDPVPPIRAAFWTDGSYSVSPSEFSDFLIRLQETPSRFRTKTIQSVWRYLKRNPGSVSNASGTHDLPGDWNGLQEFVSDSAFYSDKNETHSWFWASFQKSETNWLLLIRVRSVEGPAVPLEAAKLASKILQEESVLKSE